MRSARGRRAAAGMRERAHRVRDRRDLADAELDARERLRQHVREEVRDVERAVGAARVVAGEIAQVRQARRHVLQRVVDLVRDARGEPADRLELLRARDRHVQRLELRRVLARERPLRRERVGALHHLDRVERLLDDEQPVALAEARADLAPAIVRVRRAHDDLERRIDRVQPLDRLEPVDPRRHAHVDERDRERLALGVRGAHELDGGEALARERQHEALRRGRRGLAAEERRLHRRERVVRRRVGREQLREVRVDGEVVVDDQDLAVHAALRCRGSSSRNVAPAPRPALDAESAPPSWRAAFALAWRPKP